MPTPPLLRSRWLRLSVVPLFCLLLGCATERPKVDEPLERHQVLAELATGRLRLGCDVSCSASWRLARAKLRGLYDNKVWTELAVEVAQVGHGSDLAYFYLGRAAEETGSTRAAELYFKLSLAATNRCDGWLFNSCDGVKLPAEATAALARVAGR
jgi:hypothetical protein